MKVKPKLGMEVKRKKRKVYYKKRTALRKIEDVARKSRIPGNDTQSTIKAAIETDRKAVKKAGGKKQILPPRVLPIPTKVGGVLPLIPIFAGLSALGALAEGVAEVKKAINDASAAKEHLKEAQRHNRKMESVVLGKGLHLKTFSKGA